MGYRPSERRCVNTLNRVSVVASSLLLCTSAVAQGTLDMVLKVGDPVPGNPDETLWRISIPEIDDAGSVYFHIRWGDTWSPQNTLYKSTDQGLVELYRDDVPINGLPAVPSIIYGFALTPGGSETGLAITALSESNDAMVFLLSDSGATPLHIDGQPALFGTGEAYFFLPMNVSVSTTGVVAISIGLLGSPGDREDDRAVYQHDLRTDRHAQLIREGDLFPEGDGRHGTVCAPNGQYFCRPDMNADGASAMFSSGGIFISDGSSIRTVARVDGPSPIGMRFRRLAEGVINDEGTVAFAADTDGSSALDSVFIERNGVLAYVPLDGAAPTPDGEPEDLFREPVSSQIRIDSESRVAFICSTLDPFPDGSSSDDDNGLFIYDGSEIECVARTGSAEPRGGTFRVVGLHDFWTMHENGGVVFYASSADASGATYEGLYHWSRSSGTTCIFRQGDTIDGEVIVALDELQHAHTTAGCMNRFSEVTFRALLGDDTLAVLKWSPDNPCAADLAPPFGTLDIDDVLRFLSAFATQDPAADLAPQAGVLDIDDVIAFLTSFALGCQNP